MNFTALNTTQQLVLLLGPAMKPPPGVMPNFAHPPSRNVEGYAAVITCLVLAVILVAFRLYAKIFCMKKVHTEDYLAIAALGVYAGAMYCSFRFLNYPGVYVHQWNIRLLHLSDVLYVMSIGKIVYGIVIMLLKVGIIVEWAHVFVPMGQRNAFYWTCHAFIWLNVLFYGTYTILEIFQCTPREYIWNKLLPRGSCIDDSAINVTVGVINVTSDIAILILPQKVIWNLQISTRKRICISLIFAVGIFGCVCGGLRLIYTVRFLHSRDWIYSIAPIALWSHGEMVSGFFILCMPSIPKALRNTRLGRRFIALVNACTGYTGTAERPNSRRGLPSWYRPMSRRSRKREGEISEVDERDLITPRFTSVTSDGLNYLSTVGQSEKGYPTHETTTLTPEF